MEPDNEIYMKMNEIKWFVRCGMKPPNDLPFQLQQVTDVNIAIENALDPNWQDAGTAAQGELTGYLARTDYDVYGTSWNRLGDIIEEQIQKETMPKVNEALSRMAAENLSNVVLLDLNRIALHSAYKKRFKKVPDFYERLLKVYESGHLPCGWIGDLDLWPEGKLIVY
jgi:hypothetical protein